MKQPWFKFHPQDWQGDEGLQMCSLEARGLWIECLCIMHKNGGYLSVGDHPVTDALLAIKVGVEVDRITRVLGELETLGVFSRTRSGVIYSRRMLADIKKARTAQKNGRNGGNPTLCSEKDIPTSDNQTPAEPVIQPKMLDTRKEGEKEKTIKKEKPKADFEDFWNLFPRKVGKGAAEKAYWKAREELSKDRIHGALKAQRGEMAKREKQYIPHPGTWLNQKRYLDETGPASQTTDGWPAWKFPLAAAIGEPAVHSWFAGATFTDGRLNVPAAFKAARIREIYINDLRRIFGVVEIVSQ